MLKIKAQHLPEAQTLPSLPNYWSSPAIMALVACGSLLITACGKKDIQPARTDHPTKFTLQETLFNFGTDFRITDKKGNFAFIDHCITNLTTTFNYNDSNQKTLATGKKALISWGSQVTVVDSNNRLLGTIEERVTSSIFKVSTSYDLKDPSGKILATSGKIDFMGTSFTIKTPDSSTLATISRSSLFDVGGYTWSCEFSEAVANDPTLRILVSLIPAYKTVSDKERAAAQKEKADEEARKVEEKQKKEQKDKR